MRKKIWILNHYATTTFLSKGGRHYWFAENLINQGYEPVVICSSFLHKGTENLIKDSKKLKIEYSDKIPFVFLKTDEYIGNGKTRIKNMFQYFWQILRNYKKIEKKFGKPDVIIGSSVHPLACLAALIIGNKYKIKKIIEIRDLWPETLLTMGIIKGKTLLSWLMYKGEKYLYKKADNIIFTMEGGKQYIIDKGWDKEIDLSKVYYINNGIDLETFRKLEKNEFVDEDLDNNKFKIIYTGTIGIANNIQKLVEIAENFLNEKNIVFLIYGDGTEREKLKKYCEINNISNIKFKGKVEKIKIPYILSKANITITDTVLPKQTGDISSYGISYNKLFDYLAARKPIVQLVKVNYDIVEKNGCGIVISEEEELKDIVTQIKKLILISDEEKEKYYKNCDKTITNNFDFKILTKKLIEVIEN